MKTTFKMTYFAVLIFLVAVLFSSCSSNAIPNATESNTTTPSESSVEITVSVTEAETAVETANPEEIQNAIQQYDSYCETHIHSLPKGFIKNTSHWFNELGSLISFESFSDNNYRYKFIDDYGFRVTVSITAVDVDDIDVYRTYISPYDDGRTVDEIQPIGKTVMNDQKALAGKTVSLDRSHYTYDKNGDLVYIATVYEGNLVEFTPSDYNDKGVTFSDYENRYSFVSNFIDGWNAARVFTAGIYPTNTVYVNTADEFISEADEKGLTFTPSIKASDIIRIGNFIPDGYVIKSIDFVDTLDYERYSQEEKSYSISLQSSEDDSKIIRYSILYDRFGTYYDPFDTFSGELIDDIRKITASTENGKFELRRKVTDTINIAVIADNSGYNEEIKNTFIAFTDKITEIINVEKPENYIHTSKVTFSSYFELNSLLTVAEKAPESLEKYLERRTYSEYGFDTADKAAFLIEAVNNLPLFDFDGSYNIAYYPDIKEFSVNCYASSGDREDEYRQVQFRYMDADNTALTELTKDTSFPPMNLGSIQVETCINVDGTEYVGKWDNGTYGLIVSDWRTPGYGSDVFFNSVYEKTN